MYFSGVIYNYAQKVLQHMHTVVDQLVDGREYTTAYKSRGYTTAGPVLDDSGMARLNHMRDMFAITTLGKLPNTFNVVCLKYYGFV